MKIIAVESIVDYKKKNHLTDKEKEIARVLNMTIDSDYASGGVEDIVIFNVINTQIYYRVKFADARQISNFCNGGVVRLKKK